jgi:hypothetical protein
MRPALLVAAFVIAAGPSSTAAEITALERQRLVAHLEMTSSWLIDEVSGLSDRQVTFRRAPGTWNILEVVEHLVLVGPIYWDDLQRSVKSEPSGRNLRDGDALILWYGIDRTYREPALASESATGQLKSLRSGLDDYRKHHARLLQYVRTTNDDLRDRFVPRQGCDAYQWALLISTHEQRHILQIREIKADPTFPAK